MHAEAGSKHSDGLRDPGAGLRWNRQKTVHLLSSH
jgi:hypothetical protein